MPLAGHVISRDSVWRVSETPDTIGALLRAARDRAVPKITQRGAAAAIGMNPDYWGQVERGDAQAPAATLARMFSVVPVTGDHKEALERLRPEVAQALASTPAPSSAGEEDRLIGKLIADRPDHEVLEFIWGELGDGGRLAPRERRVRRVFEWIDTHPLKTAGRESEAG